MWRTITRRDLFGLIKDKASLFKVAVVSKPSTSTLRLSVLRATTHSPPSPPDDSHLYALLHLGDSSWTTACAIISALMERLHRTGNSVVALKCLLIIHSIIKRGPFILQDQLSIFLAKGGHNYLKLSAFRDGATAATWALSSWVRWYARYVENLLSTSRVLGYFPCSSSGRSVKENQEQRIASSLNFDLIRDVESLVLLIEETCKVPDSILVDNNLLVKEILVLLFNDYLYAMNMVLLRLSELNERLSCLSFGESVALICALNRVQDCKERLLALYAVTRSSIEMLWGSVEELKHKLGLLKVNKAAGRLIWKSE